MLPELILLGVLLVLSAFFSGSETAIFSLSKIEKRRLMTRHRFAWKTISSLLESPRRTLVTILIGNMFVNTMATTIVTLVALKSIGPQGVGWTITVFTFVLLITSELTPKVFAVRNNEFFALMCAFPLDFLARVSYPIRRVVRWIADHVLSFLIHEKRNEADLISEAELKALARIGEEEGALRSAEGDMIQRLIGLGDRMVREIMIPRTDFIAFDIEDNRETLVAMCKKYHFSYFPVYEKSIDNILGVISTQKFLLDDQNRLRELIEPPYHIPETKLIDELLDDFYKKETKVAICVDEYGGIAGLLTMEDILEEIFGEFYDEYAKAEQLVKKLGSNTFWAQGKIGLHELQEEVGIELKSETSETLNGWLLEQLGKIPAAGEKVEWNGNEFQVLDVSRRKIIKVAIRTKS